VQSRVAPLGLGRRGVQHGGLRPADHPGDVVLEEELHAVALGVAAQELRPFARVADARLGQVDRAWGVVGNSAAGLEAPLAFRIDPLDRFAELRQPFDGDLRLGDGGVVGKREEQAAVTLEVERERPRELVDALECQRSAGGAESARGGRGAPPRPRRRRSCAAGRGPRRRRRSPAGEGLSAVRPQGARQRPGAAIHGAARPEAAMPAGAKLVSSATLERRSKTVTWCPSAARACAAATPTIPAPTIATFMASPEFIREYDAKRHSACYTLWVFLGGHAREGVECANVCVSSGETGRFSRAVPNTRTRQSRCCGRASWQGFSSQVR
jgi:hypothetical protein